MRTGLSPYGPIPRCYRRHSATASERHQVGIVPHRVVPHHEPTWLRPPDKYTPSHHNELDFEIHSIAAGYMCAPTGSPSQLEKSRRSTPNAGGATAMENGQTPISGMGNGSFMDVTFPFHDLPGFDNNSPSGTKIEDDGDIHKSLRGSAEVTQEERDNEDIATNKEQSAERNGTQEMSGGESPESTRARGTSAADTYDEFGLN
ncbi:hypothetical protein V491_07331, partial [Pseudogymnoascus sp. VKM F-3775]